MKTISVVPTNGRDYASISAARRDWDEGKDFKVADLHDQWDGKPINKADAAGAAVRVRFKNLRQVGWLQNAPK
jgi:hypothetical protein